MTKAKGKSLNYRTKKTKKTMILKKRGRNLFLPRFYGVEPPGFEPGSKHMPNEPSTCVFCY